jgi:hypothetical protein
MSDTPLFKVYDLYASILNFKKQIAILNRPALNISWIPLEHQRRLQAYEILSAFYDNYSRDFRMAPESGDTSQNCLIFEAGDPAWLCNRIKSKLMGDKVSISMPGPSALKNIDALKAAGTDTSGLEKQKATITAREKFLQDWFDDNNIIEQIDENETLCSYLGDCVFMVQWDESEGRPDIKTYDPGFYFPYYDINEASLDDTNKDPVIKRIIVAWEEAYSDWNLSADSNNQYYKIWRDIWELRKKSDGSKYCARLYGYFRFNGSLNIEIDDLSIEEMIEGTSKGWEVLPIDFLPFVHIPNIKRQGHDFGESNLHKLMALFDAIINNRTDMKKNSEKLGGAVVFVSGTEASIPKDPITKAPIAIEIEPNSVYFLGENGRADLLNTAQMQEALLKTGDMLMQTLIRNSDITEIGAGLIKPSGQMPSGYALSILLQPLMEKIGPMRTLRKQRYTWLFYMVQRLWQTYGSPEEKSIFSGDLFNAFLNFGNILPADQSGMLDYYIKLGTLVDEQTVLETMKADGVNIDPAIVLQRMADEAAKKIKAQQDMFAAGNQFGTGSGQ